LISDLVVAGNAAQALEPMARVFGGVGTAGPHIGVGVGGVRLGRPSVSGAGKPNRLHAKRSDMLNVSVSMSPGAALGGRARIFLRDLPKSVLDQFGLGQQSFKRAFAHGAP
jgi:hypothetical protein